MPKKKSSEKLNRLLARAFTFKDVKQIEDLVQQGADINPIDNYQKKLAALKNELNMKLTAAATKNNYTKVNSLLQQGADVNSLSEELKFKIKQNELNQKLNHAFIFNNLIEIKSLLQQGADINIVNEHQESLLSQALDHKSTEMITLLLENGADVNVRGSYAESTLEKALRHAGKNMVEQILKKGFNPNTLTSYDDSHLLTVIIKQRDKKEKQEIVNLLLQYGADIHYKADCDSQSSLESLFYCQEPDNEMIEFLIKHALLKNVDADLPNADDNFELSNRWEAIREDLKDLQEITIPGMHCSVYDFLKETDLYQLADKLDPQNILYIKKIILENDWNYFKKDIQEKLALSVEEQIKIKTIYEPGIQQCTFTSREGKEIQLNEDVQAMVVSYLSSSDKRNIYLMTEEDRLKAQENATKKDGNLASASSTFFKSPNRLAHSSLFSASTQPEEDNEKHANERKQTRTHNA